MRDILALMLFHRSYKGKEIERQGVKWLEKWVGSYHYVLTFTSRVYKCNLTKIPVTVYIMLIKCKKKWGKGCKERGKSPPCPHLRIGFYSMQ